MLFGGNDIVAANGAVDIILSTIAPYIGRKFPGEDKQTLVENINVTATGDVRVNAGRVSQSKFRLERAPYASGENVAVILGRDMVSDVSVETSGFKRGYIYVLSENITDLTAHAEMSNVYTYGSVSGADIHTEANIYHHSLARAKNNRMLWNDQSESLAPADRGHYGVVAGTYRDWLSNSKSNVFVDYTTDPANPVAVQKAADLYDVHDISNGGEVRAVYIRNVRSSSFDALQHVELNGDGTIENTTVSVRSPEETLLDHDRTATLKAAAVRDTTVYTTNLIKVDAGDIDRATQHGDREGRHRPERQRRQHRQRVQREHDVHRQGLRRRQPDAGRRRRHGRRHQGRRRHRLRRTGRRSLHRGRRDVRRPPRPAHGCHQQVPDREGQERPRPPRGV